MIYGNRLLFYKFIFLFYEQLWVYPSIIQAHPPMQMCARHTPSFPHQPKLFALTNMLPFFNMNLAEMAEHTDQALTMINQHSIAIKKVVSSLHHNAIRRGNYLLHNGCWNVLTRVGCTFFSIK